jgi:hypothetical protein
MAKPLSDELAATPTVKEVTADKRRIRQLEALLERQIETIESLRQKRFKLPLGIKPSGRKPATFVRVIVPDTHGAHIDLGAANAFLEDLKELKPQETILLGDHLDCGGWLAQHHILGFVPETDATFADDCDAANSLLDEVDRRLATGSRKWYFEGNHEHRIVKACIKQTCGNKRDTEFMLSLWGCKAVLNLKGRGYQFVRRDELQPGLKVRGAIKLGKCFFTHGKRTGSQASQRTLANFKANVVHAHNHRMMMATAQSAEDQTLGAWCFGCLCKMQPLYYDTDPTDWSHGYGVQFVEPDGSFTTWPIPIIDGKSRLRMLLGRK